MIETFSNFMEMELKMMVKTVAVEAIFGMGVVV